MTVSTCTRAADTAIPPSPIKSIEDIKNENMFLRIENSTLIHNIMDQQKEIMRLQHIIIEQNREFVHCLAEMNARQIALEEKILYTETKAKAAMASTAIAVICAVIGGTCGFSGICRMAGSLFGSLVASEDATACVVGMIKA